jgi:hypothetical protein
MNETGRVEMSARPEFNTEAQRPQGSQRKIVAFRAKRNDWVACSVTPWASELLYYQLFKSLRRAANFCLGGAVHR